MGVVRAHVTGCAGLLTPRRLPVPAPICKDTSWLTDTLSSYLGADVKLRTPSGERSMIGFGPTFPLAPGLCPDRCVVLGTENWKNQHPAPTPAFLLAVEASGTSSSQGGGTPVCGETSAHLTCWELGPQQHRTASWLQQCSGEASSRWPRWLR